MKLTTRRDNIIKAHEEIERLIAVQQKKLLKLQELCDHEHVVMSPFKSGVMFDHHEFRLCTTCGIQESGWNPKRMHPGYGEDKTEVQMDQDDIYKIRSRIKGRCRGEAGT